MARIGIFSGTFDPVHDGHLLFAQTAMEQMGLDNVVFMPETTPRRKQNVTDIHFRAAMIQKAIAGWENFSLFLSKSGSHGVKKTMDELSQKYPDDELFLLMGADVFEHISEWPDYETMIANCGLVVALRTEDDGEIVIPLAGELGIAAEFIPAPLSSVSSTTIRRALIDGETAKGLNDDVADFIREHSLYQD